MAFDGEYVFAAALTQALKSDIQTRIHTQLTEMLGVEVDTTMAEYVVTMVGNKKSMTQIAHDLVDFIGDEHAQQFVQWLYGMLTTLEEDDGNATADTNEDADPDQDDGDDLAPPSEDASASSGDAAAPTKRVISLKSVTSSSSAPPPQKKVISLGGSSSGTIRTLNNEGNDMRDVLARRSQRFGIPEKKTTASPPRGRDSGNKRDDKTKDNNETRGNKRKADGNDAQEKRPGSASGRLSQLLGPPVNVDQAELDARDSLQTSKRKKTGRDDRDTRGNRYDQENQRDGEGNNRRQNRRRGDDDKDSSQPPLPPGSQDGGRPDRSDRPGRNDRNDWDGRDGGRNGPRDFYPPGNFRGPPGYGGFAPPPYGHPMGFYPPPYGMPPYGMGFPPQGMPPGPFMQPPMPPGPPKSHFQPRGPRAFQNKTWVNPNAPKAETAEGGEEAAAADGATPAGGTPTNPKPTTYMPRNPYFSSQMRPRFQNKTWVRPDPAKEEELSSSLPQTPPREEMESVAQE